MVKFCKIAMFVVKFYEEFSDKSGIILIGDVKRFLKYNTPTPYFAPAE